MDVMIVPWVSHVEYPVAFSLSFGVEWTRFVTRLDYYIIMVWTNQSLQIQNDVLAW